MRGTRKRASNPSTSYAWSIVAAWPVVKPTIPVGSLDLVFGHVFGVPHSS